MRFPAGALPHTCPETNVLIPIPQCCHQEQSTRFQMHSRYADSSRSRRSPPLFKGRSCSQPGSRCAACSLMCFLSTRCSTRLAIPRGGFHSMRHGAASALLADGVTPTVVQKQLRHSDARITLGIYGHVMGDQQRDAVEQRSLRACGERKPSLSRCRLP